LVLGLALLLLLSVGCGSAESFENLDVMVPMADDVRLATTVCFPQGRGPWPALLIRATYGRGVCSQYPNVTEIGIVVVTQDIRGQHDSEGEYLGFFADREDGQATLEWIAAQPWSNGRVGTYGPSAEGFVQYLMAPGAPDVLRCQWITVATPDLYAHVGFQGACGATNWSKTG
jgi:putative CocE/NonD family hydrolase